ncbi:MAG: NAD(P)/FAD-dependent oxidoreductase [Pseudorhodoplanes sp.]
MTDIQVAIIGGGAAGISAARVLDRAKVPYRLLEARPRLGGRAWTIETPGQGFPIDLGAGWLHSADRNPWTEIAAAAHVVLDKTPPPWTRPSTPIDFPLARQQEFRNALDAFYDRLGELVANGEDAPASAALLPDDPWNGLIGAVATFISGAELDKVSALDLDRYSDSGVNWRVTEGYGHLIASSGSKLNISLDCVVTQIDRSGKRIRIETSRGAIECDDVIVTIPSSCLAAGAIRFLPGLPDKLQAASRLPLGLNSKLFLTLEGAEEFEKDSRIFGATDRVATAAYQLRPFGRPQIEGYFGGSLAHDLEAGDVGAFFEFARDQLVRVLGHDFAKRIRPLALHRWGLDPFSRGAYSYAVPGHAKDRATLAASVDGRIHFAGEACSEHDYSTAHGAYLTGAEAAQAVIDSTR